MKLFRSLQCVNARIFVHCGFRHVNLFTETVQVSSEKQLSKSMDGWKQEKLIQCSVFPWLAHSPSKSHVVGSVFYRLLSVLFSTCLPRNRSIMWNLINVTLQTPVPITICLAIFRPSGRVPVLWAHLYSYRCTRICMLASSWTFVALNLLFPLLGSANCCHFTNTNIYYCTDFHRCWPRELTRHTTWQLSNEY